MSAFDKSDHTCPVCKQPLFKLPAAAGRILVWCGHDPCTSQAANDGNSGLTEQAAYDGLVRDIAAEDAREDRRK